MSIEITRLEQTDKGTLGVILVDGRVVCYSLELPWEDNKQNVSCIPTGEYQCVLEYSNRYGRDLFELKGVDGRSEVKFHVGNFLRDIKGCILTGTDVTYDDDGNRSLRDSTKAFNKFMAAMDDRIGDTCFIRGV